MTYADDEALEWLKAANEECDKMFTDGRGFDHHSFCGGFGRFPNRPGFSHERVGFDREHNHEIWKGGHDDENH